MSDPNGNTDLRLGFDLQWLPPISKLRVKTLLVEVLRINNNGLRYFILLLLRHSLFIPGPLFAAF